MRPPAILNHHFSAVTILEFSKKGGAFSDLSLKLDQAQGVGKISFDYGDENNLKIKLSVNKLDMDLLSKVKVVDKETTTKKNKNSSRAVNSQILLPSIQTKLETGGPKISLKSIPQEINAALDLSFAAIIYNKTVIRQAKINATLEEQEITISQASALLPGSTDLGVQGMIFHDKESNLPIFDGALDLATNNLRALLNWIGAGIPNVPNDRLRRLTVGGKVKVSPKKLLMNKVLVRIDGTRISGALDMVIRKRPSFGIKLVVDRLNLDGYLQKSESPKKSSKALVIDSNSTPLNTEKRKKTISTNIFPTFSIPKNIDANLDVKFNSLVAERIPFSGLTLRAQITNGLLNLSKLRVANLAGITVDVAGKIRQSQNTGGFLNTEFENLNFKVRGKNPRRIFSILNIKPLIPAREVGVLEFSGNLRGKLSSLTILTNLSLFGGVYALDGILEPLRKSPHLSGKFSIRHPNVKTLVKKLGGLYQPKRKNFGPIKLNGNLNGTIEAMNFLGLSGEIAGVKITGDIMTNFKERLPRINVDLETSTIILDDFLPVERNRVFDQSSLYLRNRQHQEFTNKQLFTKASYSGVSQEITPHTLFIRSTAKNLAVGVPWTNETIDFSFLRSFSGDVKLRSESLRIKSYQIDDIDLQSLCRDGVVDLKRLTGKIHGGTIELDGKLIAAEASSKLKTRFKIINVNTGKLLNSLGTSGFQNGALDMASELRTQGSSTLDFVRALNGSGIISIRGLEFDSEAKKGSTLSGFAGLFLSLQQFSGAMLGTNLISKRTNFNTSFRTEKGIIRYEDMTLKTGFGNGAAKGLVDLSNWQINTTGEIELSKNVFGQLFLKSPDKPKFLPFKIIGRLDNPKVKLETAVLTKGGIVLPRAVNKKLDKLIKKRGVDKLLEKVFPQRRSNNKRITNDEQKRIIRRKPKDYHSKKIKTEELLKGLLRGLAR